MAPLVVRQWNPSTNLLEPVPNPEDYRDRLSGLREKNLSPYRQSATTGAAGAASEAVDAKEGEWAGLTDHISPELLAHLCQDRAEWNISSASSMLQDRDDIPGLTPEETGLEERELGGLGIDLKRTWREGAVGRERTEGARDRSWTLGDVVGRLECKRGHAEGGYDGRLKWGDEVLGQMEACFLMVLTIANYSCLEEWKRCVELVLTCKKAIGEREEWFTSFLVVLRRQIERCEDVDEGMFEMGDAGGNLLKGWLKGFKRTLGQVFGADEGEDVKEEMEALEVVLKKMYGWELGDDFVRKGMMQLEDGEMVEMEVSDMHGEDEDGDYAPVVVDLGEDT